MTDKPHWKNTNETIWDAKDKDSGEKLELNIVSAQCSVCKRWAVQVNVFPPYLYYECCPHCGKKMS